MPEIVKSVRIVAGGGRPLHSDPGSLSWSWPGQCPDLSRGWASNFHMAQRNRDRVLLGRGCGE